MNKSIFLCIFVGFFAGVISGFLSSGGGLIILPFCLLVLNLDSVKARATTIFCILCITLVSAVLYFKDGYIDFIPAVKCALGGCVGSVFGTKILNKLNSNVLNIIFSLFLIYAGIKMMI